MLKDDERITYLAETNHRNSRVPFGIRQRDRTAHFYVTGKTGTGKSHLLRNMMLQDFSNDQGFALLDPHGDLARDLHAITHDIPHNCIWFDVADPNTPWRFNPLAQGHSDNHALRVAGLVDAFKKLWSDDWGPRLEHLLRNVLFTLLELPRSTFADVPALLTDKVFRDGVVERLTNPVVRDFWTDEFNRYSPAFRAVVTAPLQNKIGAFLTDPTICRILTTEGRPIDLKSVMNGGKTLIVNLDKGSIGESGAAVLGSFLLSQMAVTGLSRSKLADTDRKEFYIYVDEFQTFATLSIANMLAELRKYRVGLVLANQHLSQLDPGIRDAVFGNVGSMVAFRVGAADAAYLSREFAPVFSSTDLISLPRFETYVKLQIDGATSRPFSATTLATLPRQLREIRTSA